MVGKYITCKNIASKDSAQYTSREFMHHFWVHNFSQKQILRGWPWHMCFNILLHVWTWSIKPVVPHFLPILSSHFSFVDCMHDGQETIGIVGHWSLILPISFTIWNLSDIITLLLMWYIVTQSSFFAFHLSFHDVSASL